MSWRMPPLGEVIRVKVERMGGKEDGISEDNRVHIRGDVEPGEKIEAEVIRRLAGHIIVEHKPGYEGDVTDFTEWKNAYEDVDESYHPREQRKKPRWLKKDSEGESQPKEWLKEATEKKPEKASDDDGEDDDIVGSKNDLLSGNL